MVRASSVDSVSSTSSSCSSSPSASFTNLRDSQNQNFSRKSRVTKRANPRRQREKRERAAVMLQLQDLIPHVTNRDPVGQLELLQHVIDYIWSLQSQLNNDVDVVPGSEQHPKIGQDADSVSDRNCSDSSGCSDLDLDQLSQLVSQTWRTNAVDQNSTTTSAQVREPKPIIRTAC